MSDEIVHFGDREALWAWLRDRQSSHEGVWVRLGTSGGRLASITFRDLLEAGLAFGWSESARRSYDADSYLQHFTPRRSRGTASVRNLQIAARLEREGRMTDAGRAALGLAGTDVRGPARSP
jgi:uncharacterized protein YdeI (YjbR/CyaY-like superfamily)